MILYGRNLSPYARRIAIWCALQGREVERRMIAPMGETWDEVRAHNPVGRVPILILDDGTEMIETFAVCDWLDETAPEGRRLVPATGDARRACLQRLALANSLSEKAVAMVYEKNRRPEEFQWPAWQERLTTQIRGGLAGLEALAPEAGFMGGEAPDGSDIAAVIALQFVEATNPWLIEPACPRLAGLAERALALPAFAETRPEV
ncbi:glutathione S-transferase [Paralimibaculum aggregatum]|uniref:Glutathione S-transferase n=1 Tax=Paralimibaculum aggregatum TaxID=3036245 RepID=A0ABQ6LNW7_9RHOB|nr:glutathione S-transferase family protein [Limibaculum sp. NKW23]GMG84687.1 glutathione S-transferase [Limibaculum sp. NKW23]